MASGFDAFGAATIKGQEQVLATIARLFDVVQSRATFAEPVTAGDVTIITASEVNVGMGVGFGSGTGQETAGEQAGNVGSGNGGGGGGASMARPVAAIIVDRNGVRVEPIVDVTKIAVVFLTALGAIFVARRRMKQAARGR